jgi:hypothetical protein
VELSVKIKKPLIAIMAKCAKSGCDIPLTDLAKTIKCSGFCNRQFHTSCTNVTRNLESILNSTKNLLWFCDPCLHLQKNGFEKITALFNEILKSREQSKIQITELYNKLNSSITKQTCSIENAKSEIINKNEEIKISYAEILKNNEETSLKKNDAVVVVKPKNKNQGAEKTIHDIKSKINPKEIVVNGLMNATDSGIIIKCKKKEDTNKIVKIIEENLSENYEAKIPLRKNPRLKIVGIDEKPADNCEIIETIKKQNEEYFDTSSVIKVITVNEITNKIGKKYYNLIIEVNPNTYNKIMTSENCKMNINWNRCKVFDAIYVRQCLKCCSFDGHNAKDCPNHVVCFKCSGNHKSDSCSMEKFKCINCENANKNLKLNLNTEHSAMSKECEVYKKIVKNKMRSINYSE